MPTKGYEKLQDIRVSRWKCPFCDQELPYVVILKLLDSGWGTTAICPTQDCPTCIKVVRTKLGEKELLFQRLDLID